MEVPKSKPLNIDGRQGRNFVLGAQLFADEMYMFMNGERTIACCRGCSSLWIALHVVRDTRAGVGRSRIPVFLLTWRSRVGITRDGVDVGTGSAKIVLLQIWSRRHSFPRVGT